MNLISHDCLRKLEIKANKSERKRSHQNIHSDYKDVVQKLFNSISSDSFIIPHRHFDDSGDEFIIVIKGILRLFIFDENGNIVDTYLLCGNSDKYKIYQNEKHYVAVSIPPGVWHTLISISDISTILEVKKGPFIESSSKEMAPWLLGSSKEESILFESLRKYNSRST
jgi:cupin fold WbuC family metalloprotein